MVLLLSVIYTVVGMVFTRQLLSLTGLFAGIEPLTPLYDEIRRCILSEDEIADDAAARCTRSGAPCAE